MKRLFAIRSELELITVVLGVGFTFGYCNCQFMHGDPKLIPADIIAGIAIIVVQIAATRWAKSKEPPAQPCPPKGE